MLRALVFDFEGTLVNIAYDLPKLIKALKEKLRELGVMDDELEGLSHYALLVNRALLKSMKGGVGVGFKELREALWGIFDLYDRKALEHWRLKPGVVEILNHVKNRGLKLGLLTNVGRAARDFLKREGVEDLFDAVVTRWDVELLKPDGGGLLKALNQLGVAKDEALFVGDSASDVKAAKSAGVKVAVVLGGEDDEGALKSMSPDYVLTSLAELLEAGGLV